MSKPTPTTDTCSRYAADAADRHDVAQVAVGHQGRAIGAAGDILELLHRVRLVLAEHGHVLLQCGLHRLLTSLPHSRASYRVIRSTVSMRTSTNCADDVGVRHAVA